MINDLVSIIIPIYNAEKWLDRCISSVINQTYQNIEIILVNDGSIDSSGEICKKYCELDKRVKYYFQCNQGVAKVRKNGAKFASGKYIGFVDADDYIDADFYQKMMECSGNYDLIITQWYRDDGRNTRRAYDKLAVGAYDTQADMDFLLDHLMNVSSVGGRVSVKSGIAAYTFSKLYKASIAKEALNEIDETIALVEDIDFTYRHILKCKSVLITDICGYHYTIWNGSESHKIDRNCNYLRNVCKLYKSLLPVFEAHPRHDMLLSQWQFKISAMITKAPNRMGFPSETQNRAFFFPFCNMMNEKNIVLYGGGPVGRVYWHQILKYKMCKSALWVDPHWESLRRAGYVELFPVDALQTAVYDYVIIAVSCAEKASQVKRDLFNLGVGEERILWREPLQL